MSAGWRLISGDRYCRNSGVLQCDGTQAANYSSPSSLGLADLRHSRHMDKIMSQQVSENEQETRLSCRGRGVAPIHAWKRVEERSKAAPQSFGADP